MSQSAKGNAPQGVLTNARRGWAGAAGEDALLAGGAGFARAGFADPAFVLRWRAIAGAEVARIASPLKLQENSGGAILTLKCDPGAAVFLQHHTRALIERLNVYLGSNRIARIKLIPGRIGDPSEPLPHPALGGRRADEPKADEKPNLFHAIERLGAARLAAGSRPRPDRPD
jgi:hypothetical protein